MENHSIVQEENPPVVVCVDRERTKSVYLFKLLKNGETEDFLAGLKWRDVLSVCKANGWVFVIGDMPRPLCRRLGIKKYGPRGVLMKYQF